MDGFEETGGNYFRDGTAKGRGIRNLCKKKLCILSSDKKFIFELMLEATKANDCYQVKICKDSKLEVYFGEWMFTNDSSVGDAWSRYESHPKVWAVIQDDEFCESFKNKIRTY